jgi:hypothetical protein
MAKSTHAPQEGTYNFAQVLKDEDLEIARQCAARGASADLEFDGSTAGRGPDRFGLCFSGGGIRSACVGMGVLQRLAQAGLLRETHYISAISGGGYLLGWLTAWTRRSASLCKVEAQLGRNTSSGREPVVSPPPAFDRFIEPSPIHYLRKYSSYLTPRVGLLSGDTLAMISVYLRNLFLNQLLLAASLVCLTLILQLFSPAILWRATFPKYLLYLCAVLFLVSFAAGVGYAAISLKRIGDDQNPKEKSYFSKVSIGCGLVACTLLWFILPSWYVGYESVRSTVLAVSLLAVLGFLLSIIRGKQALSSQDSAGATDVLRPVKGTGGEGSMSLIAAWVVFAGLCDAISLGFRHWLLDLNHQAGTPGIHAHVSDGYVIFGLPALLLALTFQSYLFIGILGTSFPDGKREWLARAAGYFLLFAGCISLLMAIALWGPLAMHLLFSGFDRPSWRKYLISIVLPGGWLFVVLTGLLGARSSKTSGNDPQPGKLGFIIAIAPPVFLVGLLMLVSWGTHALVRHTLPFGKASTSLNREYLSEAGWTPTPATPAAIGWSLTNNAPYTNQVRTPSNSNTIIRGLSQLAPRISWHGSRRSDYIVLFAAVFFIAFLLSVRLDVNEFSLHLFYRNRLVRAFLGASQLPPDERRPSPFTGFALKDDMPLDELTMDKSQFQGPYPIWGTTLNLTAGEDLAWQQRKGASFIYSPLYCGWDYNNPKQLAAQPEQPAFNADTAVNASGPDNIIDDYGLYGFRATGPKQASLAASAVLSEGYGGAGGKPYIGTAMAASGAAVSPNSGYHTRPGVAALLAIFNLRLGWWTGNPRNRETWKTYAPSITYLVAELMGYANDTGQYVYLSDGGHFENLGLYELVRRKVRFIICSDADADASFTFQDLGNAIDKCRRDFGVEIHLRAQRDIAAEGGIGFRSGHYAIGEIVYPGQAAKGCLLYIKSSLTNDEPSDVLGMKAQDAAFPHDTTANQFFNESMFESYRALGEHMLDVIFCQFGVKDAEEDKAALVRTLFQSLVRQGEEQKNSDSAKKPPPLAVAITGGVSVQVTS